MNLLVWPSAATPVVHQLPLACCADCGLLFCRRRCFLAFVWCFRAPALVSAFALSAVYLQRCLDMLRSNRERLCSESAWELSAARLHYPTFLLLRT